MIHHVYVFTYLTSFVHVNLGGKEIVNEWMQNLKMKLLQNEITSQQTGTDISSAAANSDEVHTVQMPRIIGRAKRKKSSSKRIKFAHEHKGKRRSRKNDSPFYNTGSISDTN